MPGYLSEEGKAKNFCNKTIKMNEGKSDWGVSTSIGYDF
jgi:hypothetical protein